MDNKEPTRVRKGGTRVTTTLDGEEIIAACRSIVANKQYEKINGVMVDLYSASAIVKVYDACSQENKYKFKALPVGKMVKIAFSVLK